MSEAVEHKHKKLLSKKAAYSRGRFLTACLIVSLQVLDQYVFYLKVERNIESRASFVSLTLFFIALLIHYHSKLKQIEIIEYYKNKLPMLSNEQHAT